MLFARQCMVLDRVGYPQDMDRTVMPGPHRGRIPLAVLLDRTRWCVVVGFYIPQWQHYGLLGFPAF